jgi:peptidoglycan-associated lipoprotein
MNSMEIGVLIGIALATVGAVGCANHEVQEPRTPVGVDTTPQPISTTATTGATLDATNSTSTNGMNISNELVKACDLHFANIDQAPKFDFDKSDLRHDDQNVLSEIAECVTTGPLEGRQLELVGRADPRGEVEYNFVLGEHRASGAQQYLIELGVNPKQVGMTSRGKLDAGGTDEAGWQRDRRVDVNLR